MDREMDRSPVNLSESLRPVIMLARQRLIGHLQVSREVHRPSDPLEDPPTLPRAMVAP
jgi:hypothetical protein